MCEQTGALTATSRELRQRGHKTKEWTSRNGRHHAGPPCSLSSLSSLLRNVLYKGFVSHKGVLYPGEQAALVRGEVWERVNQQLDTQNSRRRGKPHFKEESH